MGSAYLYKYAYLAYIGGGFTRGVHSILEPGIYGCAVSFGPYIEILDELQDICNMGLGLMIKDDYEMVKVLQTPKDKLKQTGNNLRQFIIEKNNAADQMLWVIEGQL